VTCTPSLSRSNRFSVLPVDEVVEIDEIDKKIQVVQNSIGNAEPRVFRPKWERRLPPKLVIASTDESSQSRSLKLKVDIETTDTGEVKSLNALVDCGATGRFIDRSYVRSNRLMTKTLSRPVPVYNVDGSLNESGSITEVVDLILRYKNHSERALFAVTGLGKQTLILGLPWLQLHNPEIDWAAGTVKMNRCPPRCCSGCRDELREERRSRKAESGRINKCSAGLLPALAEDLDESEEDATPPKTVIGLEFA
jgi:hypothetical protein